MAACVAFNEQRLLVMNCAQRLPQETLENIEGCDSSEKLLAACGFSS
jgi:hypothetical protein